jgi:hypothetical protein
VLSLFLAVPLLCGSGSYASRLPMPGMGLGFQANNDMERYELGKALVAGRVPASGSQSPEDLRLLEGLQHRLPPSAKKNIDLTKLQGLSPAQWSALRYFLELRYKIK